jgi:hypothetical protein
MKLDVKKKNIESQAAWVQTEEWSPRGTLVLSSPPLLSSLISG